MTSVSLAGESGMKPRRVNSSLPWGSSRGPCRSKCGDWRPDYIKSLDFAIEMASLRRSASGVNGAGAGAGGKWAGGFGAGGPPQLVLPITGVDERSKYSRCWSCTKVRPAPLVPGPFIPFPPSLGLAPGRRPSPGATFSSFFPHHRSSGAGLSSATRCNVWGLHGAELSPGVLGTQGSVSNTTSLCGPSLSLGEVVSPRT